MSQPMPKLAAGPSAGLTGPLAVEYRARGLLDALRKSPSSLDASIDAGFDRLLHFSESLLLVSDAYAPLHNWIVGARDLWKQGEPRAAHYQVKLVCKKLQIKDL